MSNQLVLCSSVLFFFPDMAAVMENSDVMCNSVM